MNKLLIYFLAFLIIPSCSGLKTPHFEQKAADQIIKASVLMNSFYSELSQEQQDRRNYETFKKRYIPVSAEFYSLKIINGARGHNSEFIKISDIIIDEWERYEKRHKEKNKYPDVLIKVHRRRLNSILMSMLRAETKIKELK